jgi:hypothetical protein
MKTIRIIKNNTTWPGVHRIMKHNKIIKIILKREREERNNIILNRFVNSALD